MTHEINTGYGGGEGFERQCDEALDRAFYGEDEIKFTAFFNEKAVPMGKFAVGFMTYNGGYAFVLSSIREVNHEASSTSIYREGVYVAFGAELTRNRLLEFLQDCPIWLTDIGRGV